MNGLSSLSASQGLQASMRIFDRAAAAVSIATAQASNELADPAASSSVPDMVDAMVGMRLAANGVKANITMVKTADEMLGTLLDMQA
jgi:flagellar hook protein FlgE